MRCLHPQKGISDLHQLSYTYSSTEGTTDNDDVVPLLATHKQASMEHEKVCICMRTLKDTISLGTTHDYAVLEWKLKWELTTTS